MKTFIQLRADSKSPHNRCITALGVDFFFIFAITIYCLESKKGLSIYSQVLCWLIFLASFITPIFCPHKILDRIIGIGNALFIPFTMMSLTYEPLFYLALFTNLYYWMIMEYEAFLGANKTMRFIEFTRKKKNDRPLRWGDARRGFFIMNFIFVSFFGTGNIASVSSFDPNWVRCLVSTFSPFLMTTLIIIKLLIPILLVTCFLKAIHVVTQVI